MSAEKPFTEEDAEVIASMLGDTLEPSDALPPALPPAPQPAAEQPEGWTPDLNPTQLKIFNDPSENILGYGEKGCRTGDTMVYTTEGLRRLESLKPEGAKSGFTPVTCGVISFSQKQGIIWDRADAFWVEADNQALKAELANGAEITGSHRHPMWVCWQSQSDSGFGWKSLSEIKSGMEMGVRFWTPQVENTAWTETLKTVCQFEITENLAYAIGALVGDGSLNIFTGDSRSVGFTNCDQECIDGVAAGLAEIGCSLHFDFGYQYTVRGPRKCARLMVKELGIGHLSYFKRIPDQIVSSPKRVICAFLSGLFDTDGTVEKNGLVSLCTVSENLGRDVQDILASLGILCVRRPKKSASGRKTWTLSIMGKHAHRFGELVGFRIKRKQDRISKPKISALCPHGFNHNRYGYPNPIRGDMKRIALASRTKAKKPRDGVVYRDRKWHDRHRQLHSFGSIPSPEKVSQFCELYKCADKLSGYFTSKIWLEFVSVKNTTAQLFDLHVPVTHSFLASGTINHNTGKSIGFGHKIIRHCYEVDNALALVITPMIRTGNEGIWYDLETLILPAWREGMGLEYTNSRLDPLTKDRHRWIRNRHNGWSKILLMSIPHASQVQQRIKGPAPSFIYVDELTECDGVDYWKFTAAQLGRRRMGEADKDIPQQFTASCNPKGPSNWVYQEFFLNCVDQQTGKRDPKFAVYHVPIGENLHRLPRGYIERLHSLFKNDPTEWKRLIEGEWIDMPTGEGLFKGYYNPNIHVKGELQKFTGLEPKPRFPIYVGYDIGQMWQGITFLQCIPTRNKNVWIIFDECDHLKERVIYKMLALEVIERMRYWRRRIQFPFEYCHIADESALNQWRPGGEGGYDAWEFEKEFNKVLAEFGKINASGNVEPAKILGCPKGSGSVAARVRLIQSMLYQDMLYVSAQCENTVGCLANLESDKDDATKPKRSKWVHKFDSLSYPIFKLEVGGDPRLLLPIKQQASQIKILPMGVN
jgi:LAGLIDADG-like domain/Phage terminase large subunit